MMIKLLVCGLVIFTGSIYFTKLYLKNERMIFDIDTQPLLETDEATAGIPFSGEGTVSVDDKNLLSSPYLNLPCVYYHSITEEYRRSGKSGHWVVVENLLNFVTFYLKDNRGKLRINPVNMDSDFSNFSMLKDRSVPDPALSEIDCMSVMKHREVDQDHKILGLISTSPKKRRSEFILPPGTQIFVYGYVDKRKNELVLREHFQHPLLISQKTKEKYVEEFYKGRNIVYFIHLLLTIGFTVSFLSLNYFLVLPAFILITVLLIGNTIICGSIVFTMYNRIIILKQRAITALSNIDIELKRRADLVPQIVNLVKSYTSYEKEIMQIVTSMRLSKIIQKELPVDSGKTDSSTMLAIFEKYPTLKSADNFQQLMKTLIDVEDRLAYSRAFYNRNVRKLNTLITQFPFIIIARIFNIQTMDFVSFSTV
jgi:LemA protein